MGLCLPSCSLELVQSYEALVRAAVRTQECTCWPELAFLWSILISRRVKSRRNFHHKLSFQQDFPGNI